MQKYINRVILVGHVSNHFQIKDWMFKALIKHALICVTQIQGETSKGGDFKAVKEHFLVMQGLNWVVRSNIFQCLSLFGEMIHFD